MVKLTELRIIVRKLDGTVREFPHYQFIGDAEAVILRVQNEQGQIAEAEISADLTTGEIRLPQSGQ